MGLECASLAQSARCAQHMWCAAKRSASASDGVRALCVCVCAWHTQPLSFYKTNKSRATTNKVYVKQRFVNTTPSMYNINRWCIFHIVPTLTPRALVRRAPLKPHPLMVVGYFTPLPPLSAAKPLCLSPLHIGAHLMRYRHRCASPPHRIPSHPMQIRSILLRGDDDGRHGAYIPSMDAKPFRQKNHALALQNKSNNSRQHKNSFWHIFSICAIFCCCCVYTILLSISQHRIYIVYTYIPISAEHHAALLFKCDKYIWTEVFIA